MLAKQQFIKNTLFFQIVNWLIKPLWIFVIDREVQNYLGAELYGEYYVLFNFTFLFIVFLDLGIHTFQTREVASNTSFISSGAGGLLIIKGFLSICYLLVVWSSGILSGLASGLLVWIGLNQILSSWILYFRTLLAGTQRFKWEALVSVLDRFFAITGCALFLFHSHLRLGFTLNHFVGIQCIALLLGLVFVVGLTLKYRIFPQLNMPKWSPILRLIQRNMPFAILGLIMNFYSRLDVILINYLTSNGTYNAGVYAQSFRFLEAAGMYVMLFTGVLMPVLSKALALQQPYMPLMNTVLKLVWIPAFWLLSMSYFIGTPVLEFLYTDYAQTTPVLIAHMGSFIPMSAALILGALLTAGNHIRPLIYGTLLALLLLLLSSVLLIPRYQATGAALSVLITQISVVCAFAFIAQRNYHWVGPQTGLLLVRFVLLAILTFASSYILHLLELNLLLFATLTLLASLVLSWALKLFSTHTLKEFLKL